MAQGKKKRAAWGTKKKAAEAAAAAESAALEAASTALGESNGHAPKAKPGVGEAIDGIKGWLLPFDTSQRKQILKAVGVFLR